MKKFAFVTLLLLTMGLAGCGKIEPLSPMPQFGDPVDPLPIVNQPNAGTRMFLAKNAMLQLTEDVGLTIDYMKSNVVLKNPDLPFVAENINSYMAVVHVGHAGLTADTLARVLNNYVFAYADSPLTNLKIKFDNGKLVMDATMHKFGLNVTCHIISTLKAMPDGMIQQTPTEIYSMGLRVDGLLNLLGLTMAKLVNLKGNPVVSVSDNSIIMNPSKMMPPPEMSMKVTKVEIIGDKLWMTMDDGFTMPEPKMLVQDPHSYVHIEGGTTLSGTLLIKNTNMTFLPITGKFHQLQFHVAQHPKQLNQGLSNANNSILTLYVPDWSETAKHLNDPNWRAYPGDTGGVGAGSDSTQPASALQSAR